MVQNNKIFYTACPRNCYSTCSLKVEIENDKIKNIEGNSSNKATPNGPCLKGLSYIEREYSSQRILSPLYRKNNSDEFEYISWDNTLNLISEKLNYFKIKYGPKSIFYYSGSGTKGLLNSVGGKFWRMFGGCTTTYGDLCWPAGLEATRLTLGENKHNAPWDLTNAKLIIIWGKNSSETNIHQTVFINQALKNGARLIVIDPRRTQTSERAEILIQPRPGTDGVLALGIANQLIKNKYCDFYFINRHILGFSEFSRMVDEYTPEKVSEISDVPVEYIQQVSDLIGTIKPVSICAGFGMQRYSNSGQTIRAIISLLALTGNIGLPGAGWIFANLQNHIFNDTKDPIAFYPPDNKDDLVRVSISIAKLGQDMIKQNDPPLKMIWVERGNPITSNPESSAVIKSFRMLDFRVVVDEFLTDTAKEADIILPAKTLFEQSDIITSYWHPYIQFKQKIFNPPEEVKPETEIYYLLAKSLRFSLEDINGLFPFSCDDQIEKFLENKLKSKTGLTLENLKEKPILPPDYQEIAFSDFVFPTPSGKIELYSNETKKRWSLDPLPIYSEPVESTRRINEISKKHTLNLLTPNTKNRIHSQFGNLEIIKSVSEKPFLTINPKDAETRHIKDGDFARVFNDRGEVFICIKLDYSIKRGCISITNGWWNESGVSVNNLSSGRETDMGFGAAFHDNLVEVEKVKR